MAPTQTQDAHKDPVAARKLILDQREANERMVAVAIQAQELTDEAEAARARAEESEDRFRTLFDLAPVAVYSCDRAGVIQRFNQHAAALWGRQPEAGDTDERFCGSFKLFRPDGSSCRTRSVPWPRSWTESVGGGRRRSAHRAA
jgi:PAS domain-containing protein